MSERTKNVYLQMLQIELIGYTKVRAHEVCISPPLLHKPQLTSHQVTRTESNSWILASMSNMAIPIGSITDAIGTEIPINPEYWSGTPVPDSVAPTFQACNLSREYELEVRVGLGYGSYKHGEDQLVILPLRLPVKVYSGIAPPKALLDATKTSAAAPQRKPLNLQEPYIASNLQGQHSEKQGHGQTATPTTPTHQGFAGASGGAVPPYGAEQHHEDAPPSYEEAVGVDLPPINGYRGSYMPPPVPEDAPRFSEDRKR
jgi:hypothetical protein